MSTQSRHLQVCASWQNALISVHTINIKQYIKQHFSYTSVIIKSYDIPVGDKKNPDQGNRLFIYHKSFDCLEMYLLQLFFRTQKHTVACAKNIKELLNFQLCRQWVSLAEHHLVNKPTAPEWHLPLTRLFLLLCFIIPMGLLEPRIGVCYIWSP